MAPPRPGRGAWSGPRAAGARAGSGVAGPPLLARRASASRARRPASMEEKYLPELMAEKDSLDPSFTHALRLVNQGEGARRPAVNCRWRPLGPGEWRPGARGQGRVGSG